MAFRILKSREDFESLKLGEKISLITRGECKNYWYGGVHPIKLCEYYFIVISANNVTTSAVMRYPQPDNTVEVWIAEYESAKVGEIMVKQLEEKIKSVNEIWLSKEEN